MMSILKLDQYNLIMKIYQPVFSLFVIIFFLKEFSLLFEWGIFVDNIPDYSFLIVFLIYAILYIGPMFYPQLVDGYEIPEHNIEQEETEELSEEEKEIKELERISL